MIFLAGFNSLPRSAAALAVPAQAVMMDSSDDDRATPAGRGPTRAKESEEGADGDGDSSSDDASNSHVEDDDSDDVDVSAPASKGARRKKGGDPAASPQPSSRQPTPNPKKLGFQGELAHTNTHADPNRFLVRHACASIAFVCLCCVLAACVSEVSETWMLCQRCQRIPGALKPMQVDMRFCMCRPCLEGFARRGVRLRSLRKLP